MFQTHCCRSLPCFSKRNAWMVSPCTVDLNFADLAVADCIQMTKMAMERHVARMKKKSGTRRVSRAAKLRDDRRCWAIRPIFSSISCSSVLTSSTTESYWFCPDEPVMSFSGIGEVADLFREEPLPKLLAESNAKLANSLRRAISVINHLFQVTT